MNEPIPVLEGTCLRPVRERADDVAEFPIVCPAHVSRLVIRQATRAKDRPLAYSSMKPLSFINHLEWRPLKEATG